MKMTVNHWILFFIKQDLNCLKFQMPLINIILEIPNLHKMPSYKINHLTHYAYSSSVIDCTNQIMLYPIVDSQPRSKKPRN